MKSIKISILLIALTMGMQLQAQNTYTSVPPKESPMPMKPEMTEIWEPEVPVVTPGKKLGDAANSQRA